MKDIIILIPYTAVQIANAARIGLVISSDKNIMGAS